jgi:hypothetical protein
MKKKAFHGFPLLMKQVRRWLNFGSPSLDKEGGRGWLEKLPAIRINPNPLLHLPLHKGEKSETLQHT